MLIFAFGYRVFRNLAGLNSTMSFVHIKLANLMKTMQINIYHDCYKFFVESFYPRVQKAKYLANYRRAI